MWRQTGRSYKDVCVCMCVHACVRVCALAWIWTNLTKTNGTFQNSQCMICCNAVVKWLQAAECLNAWGRYRRRSVSVPEAVCAKWLLFWNSCHHVLAKWGIFHRTAFVFLPVHADLPYRLMYLTQLSTTSGIGWPESWKEVWKTNELKKKHFKNKQITSPYNITTKCIQIPCTVYINDANLVSSVKANIYVLLALNLEAIL